MGDAGSWAVNARNAGFKVNNIPVAGAVSNLILEQMVRVAMAM